MKGVVKLYVKDVKVEYQLEFKRNITIIKGNSARGKSYLIDLVERLLETGGNITTTAPNGVEVLTDKLYPLYKDSSGYLFLVDEEAVFYREGNFKIEDNYFVIITRYDKLPVSIEYSVNEVYTLESKRSNKVVNTLCPIYENELINVIPDTIVTEDSGSGYELCSEMFNCTVLPAGGKSKVFDTISRLPENSTVYTVVDGAVFGSYVQRLTVLRRLYNLYIFAPESIEFLILGTKTFSKYLKDELIHTEDYAEGYYSWEQYYTELLKNICIEHLYRIRYTKGKLHRFFKSPKFLHELSLLFEDINLMVKKY